MTLFYRTDAVTLYNADVREGLRALPADSVQCIVTSPPYWGLRNYGGLDQLWGESKECEHSFEEVWTPNQNAGSGVTAKQSTNPGSYQRPKQRTRQHLKEYGERSGHGGGNKYSESADHMNGRDGGSLPRKADGPRGRTSAFCTKCGCWRGELGSEPSLALFIEHLVEVFEEVKRVLRKDGTLWLNVGDSQNGSGGAGGDYCKGGIKEGQPKFKGRNDKALKPKDMCLFPARLAIALQEAGWWVRSDIVWYKSNPMPESMRDRPAKCYEHVFLLTKRRSYYYDTYAVRKPHKPASFERAKRKGHKPGHKWQSGPGIQTIANDLSSALPAAGATLKDMWTIPTQSYKGAHFATFPVALPERCILLGTSEAGCCSLCGKPWVRQTENTPMVINRSDYGEKTGNRTSTSGTMKSPASFRTTGWDPACKCDAGDPVPCVVLDPFSGSGTTGVAALLHGRHYVGIELSEVYAEMSRERLRCAAAQPALSFIQSEQPSTAPDIQLPFDSSDLTEISDSSSSVLNGDAPR